MVGDRHVSRAYTQAAGEVRGRRHSQAVTAGRQARIWSGSSTGFWSHRIQEHQGRFGRRAVKTGRRVSSLPAFPNLHQVDEDVITASDQDTEWMSDPLLFG